TSLRWRRSLVPRTYVPPTRSAWAASLTARSRPRSLRVWPYRLDRSSPAERRFRAGEQKLVWAATPGRLPLQPECRSMTAVTEWRLGHLAAKIAVLVLICGCGDSDFEPTSACDKGTQDCRCIADQH